jgi:hypothetical protein
MHKTVIDVYQVVKPQPIIETTPAPKIEGHLPRLAANPEQSAPKVKPPILKEVMSVLISPFYLGISF